MLPGQEMKQESLDSCKFDFPQITYRNILECCFYELCDKTGEWRGDLLWLLSQGEVAEQLQQ
jgi:hypothetical protein